MDLDEIVIFHFLFVTSIYLLRPQNSAFIVFLAKLAFKIPNLFSQAREIDDSNLLDVVKLE